MNHNDSVFFMGPSSSSGNLLLDQLPSYQSLLYRRKLSVTGSSRRRSGQRTRLGSSSSWKLKGERLEERPKVAPLWRPARELPLSMVEKRWHKERHMEQDKELVGWEQWWQGTRHSLKRLREEGGHLLTALQLWRTDIHVIEGMFGTGIRSYFSFLRFLVLLNIVIFLLIFGFVMLPIIAVPHASGNITSNLDNVTSPPAYRLASPAVTSPPLYRLTSPAVTSPPAYRLASPAVTSPPSYRLTVSAVMSPPSHILTLSRSDVTSLIQIDLSRSDVAFRI